jgi:hypothetical protein
MIIDFHSKFAPGLRVIKDEEVMTHVVGVSTDVRLCRRMVVPADAEEISEPQYELIEYDYLKAGPTMRPHLVEELRSLGVEVK